MTTLFEHTSMNHRYTLEPHSRDSHTMCPKCRHRHNTFKRYIDTETGSYLADHVGRCERIESCGYHYPPREYFADNPEAKPQTTYAERPGSGQPRPIMFIAWPLLEQTLKAYNRNNFVVFLARLFGPEKAKELVQKYLVGTASHWSGATVFWQLDYNERVRAGKVMLYNPATGKRVKEPFSHVSWVHGLLSPKTQDYGLKQCLFGEHLLAHYPEQIVAITESEKTAIIAGGFMPQYVWLAAGSLEGLTAEKCKVLQHRRVVLFPDVNGYDKWRQKAHELTLKIPTAKFMVDGALEQCATAADRQQGIDIADRWIKQLTIKPKIS